MPDYQLQLARATATTQMPDYQLQLALQRQHMPDYQLQLQQQHMPDYELQLQLARPFFSKQLHAAVTLRNWGITFSSHNYIHDSVVGRGHTIG